MVRLCQLCKKRVISGANRNLTFHSIPNKLNERRIWFALLGFDEDRVLPKRAVLCSDHFNKNDFIYNQADGKKYLKSGACPLLVDAQVFSQGKPSLLSTSTDSSDNEFKTINPVSSPNKKRLQIVEEHNYSQGLLDCSFRQNLLFSTQFYFGKGIPSLSGVVESSANISALDENVSSSSTLTASESEFGNMQHNVAINAANVSSTLTASESEFGNMQHNAAINAADDVTSESNKNSPKILMRKDKRKKRYVDDMSSSEGKHNFHILKKQIIKQRLAIKNLKQNVRRLKKKITSIESLIDPLKKFSLVTESSEIALKLLLME